MRLITIPTPFLITHYCNCKFCCGKSPGHPAYGICKDGTRATWGTVAADWVSSALGNLLQEGWYVRFEIPADCTTTKYAGREFVGQIHDTGGAIKGYRLDVWRNRHRDAVEGGVARGVRVTVCSDLPANWAPPNGYRL